MTDEGYVKHVRGVRYPCPECNGSGVKLYSNTSTWRHGIGGSMMTNDACDKCWGSGDEHNTWPSHRLFESMQRELQLIGEQS